MCSSILQTQERSSFMADAVQSAILWEQTILQKGCSSHDLTLAGGRVEEGWRHAAIKPVAANIRNKHRRVCQTLKLLTLLCKTKASIQELNVSANVSKSQGCV